MPVVKLDDKKIRCMIKSKDEKVKNSDIGDILKITSRRVQQATLSTRRPKRSPTLKIPERPRKPITSQEIRPLAQLDIFYHITQIHSQQDPKLRTT